MNSVGNAKCAAYGINYGGREPARLENHIPQSFNLLSNNQSVFTSSLHNSYGDDACSAWFETERFFTRSYYSRCKIVRKFWSAFFVEIDQIIRVDQMNDFNIARSSWFLLAGVTSTLFFNILILPNPWLGPWRHVWSVDSGRNELFVRSFVRSFQIF